MAPDLLQTPHIVGKLSDYLDYSRKWTLPNACASDSPYLVRRLLANQQAEGPTSFLHRPKYRQWQFKRSLVKAVEVGSQEIVQLLAKYYGDCCVPWYVAKIAASRGQTETLKWLHRWGCDIEWHVDVVIEAIRNGFLELAKWLQEKLPTTSVDDMHQLLTEWAVAAAGKGDLDMVKWYCEMLTERDSDGSLRYLNVNLWRAVQCATKSGHLHVLQWMMDEENRKVLLYELRGREFERISGVGIELSSAAASGHVTVLTWLVEHYPEYCVIDNAGYSAVKDGNLDLLRLLLSIEKRTIPNLIAVAAGNGHIDIVKFLLAEGYPVDKAMDKAAENGFLDIVKWLHDNTSHSCSAAAMDDAASNGHLDVVKWLHDNREEGCTIKAMDGAAQQGHLQVVQWLHDNREEGCSTFVMDEVACTGNLEMVKWLHLNRPEGCTTAAMDGAAGNGHLDVVKWLHVNRSEGCTTEAMDVAAGCDYLEVLKWLDQNRTEGFTSKGIDLAVHYGNLQVLQWLFSRRPELCVASLMNDAVTRGHFEMVWFLHCECGSVESLKKALRVARRRKEFAEWAYAHHRHVFESNIASHLFAD